MAVYTASATRKRHVWTRAAHGVTAEYCQNHLTNGQARIPTTREGVVAILDLACEMQAWDVDVMSGRLVKNALEAIKAGAGC